MEPRKQAIIDALARFIRQRPGLEFGNYGDVASYRAECRSIARDKREAETLLAAVSWRDGIDADDLLKQMQTGRLTAKLITIRDVVGSQENTLGYRCEVDYVTGQYFPTEYRRAACAVLASALWEYTRNTSMPAPTLHHNSETGEDVQRYNGKRAGDWLRAYFRKLFGRGIATRWFS